MRKLYYLVPRWVKSTRVQRPCSDVGFSNPQNGFDSDVNSESGDENGGDFDGEQEESEGDDEEHDYGGNHFQGGEGEDNDALDGGGDEGK